MNWKVILAVKLYRGQTYNGDKWHGQDSSSCRHNANCFFFSWKMEDQKMLWRPSDCVVSFTINYMHLLLQSTTVLFFIVFLKLKLWRIWYLCKDWRRQIIDYRGSCTVESPANQRGQATNLWASMKHFNWFGWFWKNWTIHQVGQMCSIYICPN